jgi:hypothetical protein
VSSSNEVGVESTITNQVTDRSPPAGLIVAHLDLGSLVVAAVAPRRHTTSGDSFGSHHRQHTGRRLRQLAGVPHSEQEELLQAGSWPVVLSNDLRSRPDLHVHELDFEHAIIG